MCKLGNLVKRYKEGDKEALLGIIDIFNPVIQKYDRDSYCEDMGSELVLFMITVLDKMTIREDLFKEDKYVFSYILKSLRNKYISANKKSYIRYSKESLNNDFLNYQEYELLESNIIFNDMIKDLNDIEKNVLNKRYISNLNESDIARGLNTSRQYVNKVHKKALNKLKKMYN